MHIYIRGEKKVRGGGVATEYEGMAWGVSSFQGASGHQYLLAYHGIYKKRGHISLFSHTTMPNMLSESNNSYQNSLLVEHLPTNSCCLYRLLKAEDPVKSLTSL